MKAPNNLLSPDSGELPPASERPRPIIRMFTGIWNNLVSAKNELFRKHGGPNRADLERELQSVKLELRTVNAELRKDPLTGIGNRRHMLEALAEINYQPSGFSNFALLFVDLRGFKNFNDAHGQLAGDKAIYEAAHALEDLKNRIGNIACVARLGGDEFVLVIEKCEKREALEVACKALISIEEIKFAHEEQISAAIGVALGQRGENIQALLTRANIGMSAAKAVGDDEELGPKNYGKGAVCFTLDSSNFEIVFMTTRAGIKGREMTEEIGATTEAHVERRGLERQKRIFAKTDDMRLRLGG